MDHFDYRRDPCDAALFRYHILFLFQPYMNATLSNSCYFLTCSSVSTTIPILFVN